MATRRRSKGSAGSVDSKKRETGAGRFPIVGLGASAGGLEAFEQFFRLVPRDTGRAFVLVSHLDPGHASMLTDVLGRITAMPVVEAKHRMAVETNHVYVIPPNREMTLFHGALHLGVPEEARGQRMPIDGFLRSLAEDQGETAIGVILSGTGTDGTLGLRAIHGAGGVSFMQDPATAKYDGMPSSAVRSGVATYVLPVEKMPDELRAYVRTDQTRRTPTSIAPAARNAFDKILHLVRSRTGHDFTSYKKSTVGRRVERRMGVRRKAPSAAMSMSWATASGTFPACGNCWRRFCRATRVLTTSQWTRSFPASGAGTGCSMPGASRATRAASR